MRYLISKTKHPPIHPFTHLLIYPFTLSLVFLLLGCQGVDPGKGYTTESLYRTDVQTVFVPMFESQSFRREIEYDLTRAICEQLEVHSPFKVVSDRGRADTILYGRISNVTEKVLTQQRDLDRPLENQIVLAVNVTWKDLRSGEIILNDKKFRISGDYSVLLGQGKDSSVKQAVNDLAVRVVESMEKPW